MFIVLVLALAIILLLLSVTTRLVLQLSPAEERSGREKSSNFEASCDIIQQIQGMS